MYPELHLTVATVVQPYAGNHSLAQNRRVGLSSSHDLRRSSGKNGTVDAFGGQIMRWYVNQNGKTAGPFSEQRIAMLASWRKISRDAYVCDEQLSTWVAIKRTKFAPLVANAPSRPSLTGQRPSTSCDYRQDERLALLSACCLRGSSVTLGSQRRCCSSLRSCSRCRSSPKVMLSFRRGELARCQGVLPASSVGLGPLGSPASAGVTSSRKTRLSSPRGVLVLAVAMSALPGVPVTHTGKLSPSGR